MIQMKLKEYNFNSQPHEEADGRLSRNFFRQSNFNSQPHEEADVELVEMLSRHYPFQLTASRGG